MNKENKNKIIDYFFFQHGLSLFSLDAKDHWKNFVEHLKKEVKTNYIIKYCTSNSEKGKTYDGIEHGAIRLANEICEDINDTLKKHSNRKFRLHFIGHSLGGIYFRIAIHMLFERKIFECENLIPFSFITLETPHCGVKKPQNNGTFDSLYKSVSELVFDGQTLNELTLNDRPFPIYDKSNLNEHPLLLRICEDNCLEHFKKFKHLTLIQNIKFSYQVPFVSSSIDRAIPYDRTFLKDQFFIDGFDFSKEYSDIIEGSSKKFSLQEERGEIFDEKIDGCVVHDRIVVQLNTLNWRRINVNFRTKSSDVHLFIMGDLLRNKLFKSWKNDDVGLYLDVVARIIKRDIDIENGDYEKVQKLEIEFERSNENEKGKENEEEKKNEKVVETTLFDIPNQPNTNDDSNKNSNTNTTTNESIQPSLL